jgi:BMFP domain-containing protein YqiC
MPHQTQGRTASRRHSRGTAVWCQRVKAPPEAEAETEVRRDKDRDREAAFARSMGEMLQGGEVMDDLTESSMRSHAAGPSTVSKHVSDLAAARLDSAAAKMSANTSQVVDEKLAAILDLVKSMHDQQQASVERAEASMSALTAKLEELAARQQQFEGVMKGSLKV